MRTLRWRLAVWWRQRQAMRRHDRRGCPICQRNAWERAQDLEHIAELAGQLADAEAAIATFPERLQRAYDAGQAAMLEQLTGLCAAEPWAPVPPGKWVSLMEARDQPEAN